MQNLSLKEIEFVAFQLAQKFMTWNEPIPNFSSRFKGILESCIRTPFQKFSGKSLYPGLITKSSTLFYLMIKNRPFQNGNKRIAMTTLMYFLYKNKKWLKVNNKELYEFTVWVASSPSKPKIHAIYAIEQFIKNHIINR